jgi:outer membrane lipoprotein carrier protein
MQKVFLWAGAILILWGLSSVPMIFGMTGTAVLVEIQKRYETTADFEAQFVQEYVGKVMQRPQKGEGQVYFKKKGMMRWDYQTPNQELISNGQTLWYYQPEENQVFVSQLSRIIKERTPLAFLAGEGNLSQEFNLVQWNEDASQKEGNYVVELAPKEPNPTLAKLILTVDPKTFTVTQADVIDELGNVTRTRFMNIKTNVSHPDSFFNFTIPPGTDVLRSETPASSSGGKGTSP